MNFYPWSKVQAQFQGIYEAINAVAITLQNTNEKLEEINNTLKRLNRNY